MIKSFMKKQFVLQNVRKKKMMLLIVNQIIKLQIVTILMYIKHMVFLKEYVYQLVKIYLIKFKKH